VAKVESGEGGQLPRQRLCTDVADEVGAEVERREIVHVLGDGACTGGVDAVPTEVERPEFWQGLRKYASAHIVDSVVSEIERLQLIKTSQFCRDSGQVKAAEIKFARAAACSCGNALECQFVPCAVRRCSFTRRTSVPGHVAASRRACALEIGVDLQRNRAQVTRN